MNIALVIVISLIVVSGICLIQMHLDKERLWAKVDRSDKDGVEHHLKRYLKQSKRTMLAVVVFSICCFLSPFIYYGLEFLLKN